MSFKKYGKLRRPSHPETDGLFADPDHELVITEKFDGNNFRFTYDDHIHALRFGSRNCDLGIDDDEIGGMFDDVSDYLYEQVHPDALCSLEKLLGGDVVLFGENAVEHTIDDYLWDEVPQFQLFDIHVSPTDEDEPDHWLDWDAIEMHAEKLGLETPPVVERTTVGEFDVAEYEIPTSVYRPDDGVAEGVVLRNTSNGIKAKMISESFAEQHKSAKSKNHDQRDDDVGRFLSTHVTPRRIQKNVETLIDDPESEWETPVMEMMPDLAPLVWEDVWAEDWNDVIYENWTLDLGAARSETSSKTARILRKLMKEKAVVDPGTGTVLDVETDGGDDDG